MNSEVSRKYPLKNKYIVHIHPVFSQHVPELKDNLTRPPVGKDMKRRKDPPEVLVQSTRSFAMQPSVLVARQWPQEVRRVRRRMIEGFHQISYYIVVLQYYTHIYTLCIYIYTYLYVHIHNRSLAIAEYMDYLDYRYLQLQRVDFSREQHFLRLDRNKRGKSIPVCFFAGLSMGDGAVVRQPRGKKLMTGLYVLVDITYLEPK